MQPDQIASEIATRLQALPTGGGRQLIAIAGPPASGKSTVAEELCAQLGPMAGLVAMDGFHLDNAILDARGLRPRKGAPETFDLAGFAALLRRLQTEDEVIAPRFRRDLDVSVGSAVVIEPGATFAIVEGNYLLLDAPGWRDLRSLWAFSAFLEVPEDALERRLMQRWSDNGYDPDAARQKVEQNDLPNAKLVLQNSMPGDYRCLGA